jgi:hypothetical protein
MKATFSKIMFGLGVGWIHFHTTTSTYSTSTFGYWGLFVTLKGMQLLINKLSPLKSNHVTLKQSNKHKNLG